MPSKPTADTGGVKPTISEWLTLDQGRIDAFADTTGDHQSIHVDPVAAAAGPFGVPIAHGFLLLSLTPKWLYEQLTLPPGTGIVFNYGLDKVRFLLPVTVGSRVRMTSRLLATTDKGEGRWLVKVEATIEVQGAPSPAMVAEILLLCVPAP